MDLSNDNMIHIHKEGVEYLQFRKLLEYDNVINCYTLSTNSIDFNRNKDYFNREKVNNSYSKICKALDIEEKTIVRPYQSHTDKVEIVDNTSKEYKDVDGLLTNKENIDLMLTYADCTPILLYDVKKRVIGNIHSGLRGTIKKIGQKGALKLIKEYNSNAENILAFIGPCIGKCHFEVSEDVKQEFEQVFSYLNRNNDIIEKSKKTEGKYYIDTTLINRLILQEIGIKPCKIFESGICTMCNSKIMHSYRASGKEAGRNVAIIGLKS